MAALVAMTALVAVAELPWTQLGRLVQPTKVPAPGPLALGRSIGFQARGVLSPSDVGTAAAIEPAKRLQIGGRIVWCANSEAVLADALGSLRVCFRGEDASSFAVGDLAVFTVVRSSEQFHVASIDYHERFPEPHHDDEWSRCAGSGKGRRLVQRAQIRSAVREWFASEGFLEVETSTLLEAPGLDSDVDPVAAESGWLVTSPELAMKRLLVGGIPRLYQLAKCFRRGELGPRHQPEFTMLEWYRAFSDLSQMLADTEAIVLASARSLGLGTHLEYRDRKICLEPPFLRLTVEEAFRRHAGESGIDVLAKADRDRYFQLFVDRVEPALTEYDRPVFLYDYPASEGALARLRPDDSRWAERAELYVCGIELCNAYSELNSPGEQRARFVSEIERRRIAGSPTYPLDERFLDALASGMPLAAGNALGFDRLVMLLLGQPAVSEVIAFPSSAC